MLTFNKEITIGNTKRLFVFTEVKNFNGTKFFITSKDDYNKPFSFSLLQKDAEWKLSPGSLRWLYEIEDELSEAILDTRYP